MNKKEQIYYPIFGFFIGFIFSFLGFAFDLFFIHEESVFSRNILYLFAFPTFIGFIGFYVANRHYKQKEKVLKENQQIREEYHTLKQILNSLEEAVYICNTNYEIEYLNNAMAAKIGKNVVGQKCYNALYNNKNICEWCKYTELKTKKTINYNRFDKNTQQQIDVYNTLLDNGNKLTIFKDITEKEQILLENNRMQMSFERAEEIAVMGRWEFQLEQKIFSTSEGARKIYGLDDVSKELPAELVQTAALPEYRLQLDQAIIDLVANNTPYNQTFKIKRFHDGEIRSIQSLAKYSAEKNIIFGIIRDITEEEKAKQLLVEATEKAEESNKLKSAFLNNISHEFRTPLNGIMGFIELLSIRDLSDNKKAEYTKIIKESSEKLLDIVTDIVEISKIQSKIIHARFQKTEIQTLIDNINRELRNKVEKKNLYFEIENAMPEEKAFIETDSEKLYRAIKHIIENAIKFTPQGGIKITYGIKNNQFVFTVQDTGIGISEEMQKIIFEPFRQVETGFSRNYGGNGIGLSIVKSYIELLNGKVELKSAPNKGTTISIFLPGIEIKNMIVKANNLEAQTPNYQQKTVLIAEDEASSEIFLNETLKFYKINTLIARNGTQAIDFCRNNQSIDLILMDLKMPEMDGYKASKIIKDFRSDIPIIAQTAYSLDMSKEDLLQQGFDGYIQKPIKEEELLKIIHNFFA